MSYSVCLKCKEMVGGYEKYCIDCEKIYRQDSGFWKTQLGSAIWCDIDRRNLELKKDSMKTEPIMTEKS